MYCFVLSTFHLHLDLDCKAHPLPRVLYDKRSEMFAAASYLEDGDVLHPNDAYIIRGKIVLPVMCSVMQGHAAKELTECLHRA
jgi:hypothetical protein